MRATQGCLSEPEQTARVPDLLAPGSRPLTSLNTPTLEAYKKKVGNIVCDNISEVKSRQINLCFH